LAKSDEAVVVKADDCLHAFRRASPDKLKAVQQQRDHAPSAPPGFGEQVLKLSTRAGTELSWSDPAQPIPKPCNRDFDHAF
jgi:hypothetical protein